MSQLAIAILKKVQETAGLLVIQAEDLFLASGEARKSYLEAQRYCDTLGIWILA